MRQKCLVLMKYQLVLSTMIKSQKRWKPCPRKESVPNFQTEIDCWLADMLQFYRNASAVRKFHISESTVKLFCIKYESSLTNVHSTEEVTKIPKTWPLMTGKLLEKQVQEYLYIYRKKGCIVNKVLAVATAKALIERSIPWTFERPGFRELISGKKPF